jgi:hypothetical protein
MKLKIKNFNVLINEEQASCGLVVNNKDYDLHFFNNEHLHYEVDYHNKVIHVTSRKDKVSFLGLDNKIMYYAFKTETLIILTGDKNNYSNVYEAILKI